MKKIKTIAKLLIVLLLIAVVCVVYAFCIEPRLLTVKKYKLGDSENQTQVLRVVQISDIEMSKDYTPKDLFKMTEKVQALKPDVVVFTGDLFSNYSKYRPVGAVEEALSGIDAPYGKYAVWGNNDYGGGASRDYEWIMNDAGFTVLQNEGVNVEIEPGKYVYIGGADDGSLGYPDFGMTMQNDVQEAVYKILLVHEPDLADEAGGYGIDLALAGHSHGGQVKLPFVNLITTSMARKYTSGFYTPLEAEKLRLYVNSGLGTSQMGVRFGVPPQVAVFDIAL